MPDMLVKLYDVAGKGHTHEALNAQGVEMRRALPPEMSIVIAWVKEQFGQGWADECAVAFANKPVSCYIAVQDNTMLGFACYDATYKNFFGPTGVKETERGRGLGRALLLACMEDMYAQGYGYAIIGGAGPTAFYEKAVGAVAIEGSSPGIYRGMLRHEK